MSSPIADQLRDAWVAVETEMDALPGDEDAEPVVAGRIKDLLTT